MSAGAKVPVLKATGLDQAFFQRIGGTQVQTEAAKFVIPVGNLANPEPLVVPQGAANAGDPILDWEGNPIGKEGVVFYNGGDNSWVGAPNGTGIIISNEVSEAQAQHMLTAYHQYIGPNNTSLERLKTYLMGPHKVGGVDTYNSTLGFAKKNFSPVGDGTLALRALEQDFGWMHRERNPIPAVFISDGFVLKRPGAEETISYEAGALLLAQPGEDFSSAIQPDIAARTYNVAATGLSVSTENVMVMSAATLMAKIDG